MWIVKGVSLPRFISRKDLEKCLETGETTKSPEYGKCLETAEIQIQIGRFLVLQFGTFVIRI